MRHVPPRRLILAGLACALVVGAVATFAGPAPVAVAPPGDNVAHTEALTTGDPGPPTEVLVRFAPRAEPSERAAARRAAEVEFERSLPLPRLQLVRPAGGVSVEEAVSDLERSPAVSYAEPDVARRALALPDDELFKHQWGLHNTGQLVGGRSGTVDADVDGPEAWDLSTGAAGVTVAVVDTGMDAAHPDLAPNVWTNPGESGRGREANGLDDDGNGYVDDVHGWDFVGRDGFPDDGNGHGTHVAGTVGARGNDGLGVTGVAWRVGLLPLRVLGDDGSGRVSDLVTAYSMADELGIRIVNASLGGGDFSRSERDAIRAATSTLFVVAAGNDSADNDVTGSYPCNYDAPNIVCVAAVDRDGTLASFSNRGATSVDLAAPGVAIASTYPAGKYQLLSGTSMATPHVAGAAALIWSLRPDLRAAEVRDALLSTTVPHPTLLASTVTGGTLNLRGALDVVSRDAADAQPPAPTATPTAPPAQPSPDSSPDPSPDPSPTPEPAPEPTPTPAPIIAGDPPAPAIAPGAASDAEAPSLRVEAPRARRLARILRRGVGLSATCSELCTLRARLTLGRDLVLGRARGGTVAGTPDRLRVRVLRRHVRRLRRSRRGRLTLVVAATDQAGNAQTVRRTLRLRRV